MMERIDIKTAMFILTTLSVVAPAANYLSPSTTPAVEESADGGAGLPTRSASEMKAALLSLSLEETGAVVARRPAMKNRHDGLISRDPFRLIPLAPPSQSIVEPIPAIELIGLVQTNTGTVATLGIDGVVTTLRIGETASGVKLKSVTPPDGAVVGVGKREVKVRLL